MRLSPLTAVLVLALSVPVHPATAQSRRAPTPASVRDPAVEIPESMKPPAGKCRIWMLDVPAKQQPAATDCTTALRQKPANAVLVFGPAVRDLSPFEARKVGRRPARDTARSRAANGDTARSRAENDDPTRSRAARGDTARDGAEADPRKAEPRKAEPQKTEPQKAGRRPQAERRGSTRTRAEPRVPAVSTRAPAPATRRPTKPTPKKPERP